MLALIISVSGVNKVRYFNHTMIIVKTTLKKLVTIRYILAYTLNNDIANQDSSKKIKQA